MSPDDEDYKPKPEYAGPGRETESLLERLAESAIEDAYYDVNRTRSTSIFSKLASLIAITLLAFALTIVTLQSRNDRPATEYERRALIASIEERQEVLTARRSTVEALQTEIEELYSRGSTLSTANARDELNAAATGVIGDGVVLELTSAQGGSPGGMISDLDVQIVVNGLWMSGAEAVDIAGHRLTSTSAIRSAGDGITVNYRSVPEPIVIRAIGSPKTLEKQFRLSPSGRYLTDRAKDSGINWSIEEHDQIAMSAAPKIRLKTRHAHVVRKGES